MELTLCVPCLFGLEGLAADELKYMGCRNVRSETGRVLFDGDERDLVRANLWLRTGERVYVLLGEFPAPTFDALFEGTKALEWEKLIEADSEYGEIVCRCNTITKAEVRAAIRNPLGVHTVTGVKYRCRTMMGRCQGGYCQTRVTEMIMQETGLSREELLYSRPGSWMFSGKVREE